MSDKYVLGSNRHECEFVESRLKNKLVKQRHHRLNSHLCSIESPKSLPVTHKFAFANITPKLRMLTSRHLIKVLSVVYTLSGPPCAEMEILNSVLILDEASKHDGDSHSSYGMRPSGLGMDSVIFGSGYEVSARLHECCNSAVFVMGTHAPSR